MIYTISYKKALFYVSEIIWYRISYNTLYNILYISYQQHMILLHISWIILYAILNTISCKKYEKSMSCYSIYDVINHIWLYFISHTISNCVHHIISKTMLFKSYSIYYIIYYIIYHIAYYVIYCIPIKNLLILFIINHSTCYMQYSYDV